MEKILYKILNTDGSPCNGGTGRWPLPANKKPGKYLEVKGRLTPCQNGLHLCRVQDLPYWIGGEHIYTVEYSGEKIEESTKVVVRKAHLLKLVGVWSPELSVLFAKNCAEYAAEYAGYATEHAKRATEYVGYVTEYAGYAAKYAGCAEYAKYAGCAEYAKYAAKYAKYAADSAGYAAGSAQTERLRQGKLILELAKRR